MLVFVFVVIWGCAIMDLEACDEIDIGVNVETDEEIEVEKPPAPAALGISASEKPLTGPSEATPSTTAGSSTDIRVSEKKLWVGETEPNIKKRCQKYTCLAKKQGKNVFCGVHRRLRDNHVKGKTFPAGTPNIEKMAMDSKELSDALDHIERTVGLHEKPGAASKECDWSDFTTENAAVTKVAQT